MKKLFAIAAVLCIVISLSFTTKNTILENKLTATYKGVTNEDFYKFEDDAKKITLFYDIDENIEISLYDDDLIGTKYIVTWIEKEIEQLDEEGEITGAKIKVKSITAIEEAK
ncbi:hypothetical protein [Polaribacter sp.]|uniref:hypothetical protein n=1 Tax=Polaribacter sp. TaxID=1920175 RepID=UPI003F6D8B6B